MGFREATRERGGLDDGIVPPVEERGYTPSGKGVLAF